METQNIFVSSWFLQNVMLDLGWFLFLCRTTASSNRTNSVLFVSQILHQRPGGYPRCCGEVGDEAIRLEGEKIENHRPKVTDRKI